MSSEFNREVVHGVSITSKSIMEWCKEASEAQDVLGGKETAGEKSPARAGGEEVRFS